MLASLLASLPREPEVLVETSRWGFIKRRPDGSVDFISPVPCPYNYGCIPGFDSEDGDPLDVIILGPRLRRGERVRVPVVGAIAFVDGGRGDPKVVCSPRPLRGYERAGLELFFRLYAPFKWVLHLLRGHPRETRFAGFLTPGAR
ncbi:inorganic diphosphatase [Myxococcaceae bacterium GXIMD 01537]